MGGLFSSNAVPNDRSCAQCGGIFGRDSFSSNQWGKGTGASRCHSCVHGGPGGSFEDVAPKTKRENVSRSAVIYNPDHPFAQGTFRWVAKGEYSSGPRKGQPCVCKWFKSGTVFQEIFFAKDIKANEKATHIIQLFNSSRFIAQTIRINQPEVWTYLDGPRSGEKILIEPFIDVYQKFNSNSGWADGSAPWARVMQALSHFSYHASGGQFLLCDLQGGVHPDQVILTDPVILSRSQEYGVTDLGADGIRNFFARHQCNEFCKAFWTKPSNLNPCIKARRSTMMIMP
jgi:hypothetical protein